MKLLYCSLNHPLFNFVFKESHKRTKIEVGELKGRVATDDVATTLFLNNIFIGHLLQEHKVLIIERVYVVSRIIKLQQSPPKRKTKQNKTKKKKTNRYIYI